MFRVVKNYSKKFENKTFRLFFIIMLITGSFLISCYIRDPKLSKNSNGESSVGEDESFFDEDIFYEDDSKRLLC